MAMVVEFSPTLDRADRHLKEGKVKKFTSEEWDKFVN